MGIPKRERRDTANSPGPCLVGLIQDEQRRLVVTVEELHVDDIQQLLVQLADVDDVAGQKAGLGPVGVLFKKKRKYYPP